MGNIFEKPSITVECSRSAYFQFGVSRDYENYGKEHQQIVRISGPFPCFKHQRRGDLGKRFIKSGYIILPSPISYELEVKNPNHSEPEPKIKVKENVIDYPIHKVIVIGKDEFDKEKFPIQLGMLFIVIPGIRIKKTFTTSIWNNKITEKEEYSSFNENNAIYV